MAKLETDDINATNATDGKQGLKSNLWSKGAARNDGDGGD